MPPHRSDSEAAWRNEMSAVYNNAPDLAGENRTPHFCPRKPSP